MNTNHVTAGNGKVAAVCDCCDRKSRLVIAGSHGEPELWNMGRGWSQAPFPADYMHPDGSIGSMYTCPACNKLLRSGIALTLRGGKQKRLAA